MTPTAIPSGILWSVTAKTSIVVFSMYRISPPASLFQIEAVAHGHQETSKTGSRRRIRPQPAKSKTLQIRGNPHGRNQKRPHGSCHHNTGGKAQQSLFHVIPDPIPHKINACCPYCCPGKWNQDSKNDHSHYFYLLHSVKTFRITVRSSQFSFYKL